MRNRGFGYIAQVFGLISAAMGVYFALSAEIPSGPRKRVVAGVVMLLAAVGISSSSQKMLCDRHRSGDASGTTGDQSGIPGPPGESAVT